jgi:hypothetical protein
MTTTIAVITHDRFKKLNHLLYEIGEQTVQPDRVEIYASGYDSTQIDDLIKSYPDYEVLVHPDKKDWGHDKRAIALTNCQTDYIVTMNDDDQYPYVFLEFMLNHAKITRADIVYCDFATRTQEQFLVDAKLERGSITNGCMLIGRKIANRVPYDHRTYAGDWYFVEECIKRKVKFEKLALPLFFAY